MEFTGLTADLFADIVGVVGSISAASTIFPTTVVETGQF